MTARNDPFRTLDDPEPEAAAAIRTDPIQPGTIVVRGATGWEPGYWQLPAKRPNWCQRLVVWLLLGWTWKPQ